MKIYIENIDPQKTTNEILAKLNKFLTEKKEYIEVYSEEGIYNISSKKMDKTKKYSEKSPIKITSPFSAIIDYVTGESEPVHRLPIYHCAECITEYSYSINKTSPLKLIVKGFNKDRSKDVFAIMKEKSSNFVESSSNTGKVFQTTDVFFTMSKPIQPLELSKYIEEFNEFFIALK